MQKECKCQIIYNGYSMRVLEDYEAIKEAINDGSTWLQLTEQLMYQKEKKHLVNIRHIVSINPIGYE